MIDYLSPDVDNPMVWGMLEEQTQTEELERSVYGCISHMVSNYGNKISLYDAMSCLSMFGINFATLPSNLKEEFDKYVEIAD